MSTRSSNYSNANTETATVYPSHGEGTRGHSNSYPPAEAKYEEIARNPDFFFEKLKGFHEFFGSKFKVPTIGGRALDLFRLFIEVTSRGGIEKVIRDRKWKEVISAFNFPSTITSASFVLRKYYLSLLYHFEQVYYFRKEIPSMPLDDPGSRIPVNGSAASHLLKDGAATNQLAGQGRCDYHDIMTLPYRRYTVNCILEPGSSVSGTIDAKFDNGYLITVNLGSEKLNGVLYHTPLSLHTSQISNPSVSPPHRDLKNYQLALRDPSQPKPNRSGYNFFFAEHYARLKSLYNGQEQEISKKIEVLWSRLTDAEKQVYQDKALRG